MRVLFGISCLGLRLCILCLGDHIPDCESVFQVFGLDRRLNLLTLSSPCWDFNIRRRGLDGGELLRRKERVSNGRRECRWNFLDVLQKENVLGLPQLGVNRDSHPVKCLCPYLSAIVPAHSYHFFCQLGLRFQHPTFIGCCLRSLRSFPGHPSCILSFLQLIIVVQDQLSLGDQLYLSHVKLFALVLGLYLYILQTRLGTQTCLVRGD